MSMMKNRPRSKNKTPQTPAQKRMWRIILLVLVAGLVLSFVFDATGGFGA
ncbi:hypothetical protein [Breoghania sp.]|nr:hypothetical protein [Breoghania sp.]